MALRDPCSLHAASVLPESRLNVSRGLSRALGSALATWQHDHPMSLALALPCWAGSGWSRARVELVSCDIWLAFHISPPPHHPTQCLPVASY